MASKLCDSCKSATSNVYCRADSAFLCINCDAKIHAANKLASRHARVWVCEVCEQAPAHVTCKADAAALCVSCDRDIHSANPLARRHERVPVTPFYDSVRSSAVKHHHHNFLDEQNYFNEEEGGGVGGAAEEAEAASWLLPNPKVVEESNPDLNTGQFVFSEMDPYLDLDYNPDPKGETREQQNSSGTDGVVPVQTKNVNPPLVNDFDLDFSGSKTFGFGFNSTMSNNSVRKENPNKTILT